ncbi:predicted protein [Lichtheimia corymbifera JMRC:FSU:9682]|uniref:Uncharacterized protein n=1 Tax=Lichtheimia corymbifera JMRC:FSU:9682 TaxID=1263082 RepID=A0A068SGP0_9FUNG|nr:predicted protein [Lichtheimia corymbifera JMRC:FSU:9682]
MSVTQNSTMKRGVFIRTKLRGGVKRTLCTSFTIVVAILRFTQCHHQPKWNWVDLENFFSTLAGGDIAKSRSGEPDRETCTQGALHPDEQLCSMKEPMFQCKV